MKMQVSMETNVTPVSIIVRGVNKQWNGKFLKVLYHCLHPNKYNYSLLNK